MIKDEVKPKLIHQEHSWNPFIKHRQYNGYFHSETHLTLYDLWIKRQQHLHTYTRRTKRAFRSGPALLKPQPRMRRLATIDPLLLNKTRSGRSPSLAKYLRGTRRVGLWEGSCYDRALCDAPGVANTG